MKSLRIAIYALIAIHALRGILRKVSPDSKRTPAPRIRTLADHYLAAILEHSPSSSCLTFRAEGPFRISAEQAGKIMRSPGFPAHDTTVSGITVRIRLMPGDFLAGDPDIDTLLRETEGHPLHDEIMPLVYAGKAAVLHFLGT